MAVTEQNPRNVSTAAAGATVFPYNFRILDKRDLLVTVNGVARTVDAHYTVSGVGAAGGGNVTFLSQLAGGEVVMRKRNMKLERLTDYQNLGDLRSPTLNNDQDAPVMMVQQLADDVARSLRIRPDYPLPVSVELPTPEASRLIGWNADGSALRNTDPSGPGDLALRSDLADATGGGELVAFGDPIAPSYLKTTSDIINGERVSVLRGISTTEWSGIRAGTNSKAFHVGINDMLAQMGAIGYGDLYFPAGFYGVGAPLSVPSNVSISGVRGRTWLRPEYNPAGGTMLLNVSGRENVTISGLGFDGRMPSMDNFVNTVVVFQSSDVVFEDCTWKDCKGIAVIFSSNVARSGVRNSRFSNCGTHNLVTGNNSDRRQAVALSSGTLALNLFNFVEDCHFEDIGLDAISISNQSHFTAARNKLNRNYAGGIYDSGSIYTSVTGNHLVNCGGNAIDVNGADYGIYSNNVIRNPVAAGVMLAGELTGSVVVGNMIRGAMQNPATLHKGAITLDPVPGIINHVVISGNVCEGNNGWGFYVRPGATPQGAIYIDPASNHFANNALGAVMSSDSAFVGSVGKTGTSVSGGGGTMKIIPATSSTTNPNHAIIEVVNTSTSQIGVFLARGTSPMQKLLDPGSVYEATDTGTETAVYYDSVSGNIMLKNRAVSAATYRVSVRGIGHAVG